MDDALELAKQRRNALRREQYRLDGGKRKAENQAWKDAHREQVRDASRKYAKLYREQYPDKANESRRKWAKKNRSKLTATHRDWVRRHPGYEAKKRAEYQKKDPVRYMLFGAKNRAKEMGLDFSITRDDVAIPEICPVLGLLIQPQNKAFHPNSPSLDRFDSSKGYIPGNVFVISNRANVLKRDGTLDEFRKIVAYMERG